MSLTPIGVFGAMAYNVSHMASGTGSRPRGLAAVKLLGTTRCSSAASIVFALLVLVAGDAALPASRSARSSATIREPALIAFSTASSEAALPQLLEQIVEFGVPRRVASFVIPTGYSFNLDGSTLYLVLATHDDRAGREDRHDASPSRSRWCFTFMLTSKGVAGVPRATLVIIAGTCAGFGLPGEAGVAMILAVDEIMDMARSAINLTGNGARGVVIARWEGVLGPEASDGASAS